MRAIRYIIFILVVIGLIWLIVLLFQSIFSNSNDTVTTQPDIPELSTYADTSAVATLFIDGPIVANQEHKSVRISVDRNQSRIEVISGYDNNVISQQAFASTEASYKQFLSALDRLSFTQGDTDLDKQTPDGSCPFGRRYTYTLKSASESVVNFWTTSCSPKGGTYQGEHSATKKLFLAQIPRVELREITNGISL